MKRFILILAAAMLFCSSAIAQSSVMRQDKLFAVQLNDFSRTETHAMQLTQGQQVDINVSVQSGSAEITVKRANGEVIFEGSDHSMNELLTIDADGIYRFVVSGSNANGSVHISLRSQAAQPEKADVPYQRAIIESALGFFIEYSPERFEYVPGDAMDLFYLKNEKGETVPDAMLSLARMEGTLDGLDPAEFDEETPPTMIDWRAARSFRTKTATEEGTMIYEFTYIELNGETLFATLAQCTPEVELEMAQLMRDMVASLRFME